uniref:Uncharacterized protein n=1 Tax=Timema poppense TaxID=170557 RepID=A0A7R9CQU3_TIMPO|nr:unnamed protein product [Timema poppensis]
MVNDEGEHVLGRNDTLGSKPFHNWIHFKTDSVMFSCKQTPYLRDGCSGRPTRTLIELIAQPTCIDCK